MGFNLHADNSNDPPQVRNWRVHLMAIIVSMGSVAMGYDTSVIGGSMALDSFRRDFGLVDVSSRERDTLQGNIVSTFQAGTFFGALLTFPLGEKFGRKKAIMMAISIFLVGGSIMTASSGHLGLIYAGRAIAGFGIGSVSLLVPVYIAETSPPSIRGRLVGIFEICSQAGGMCGFWINYIVDRTISDETAVQWQVPLGLQLLPGVLLLAGILWCPESPRWYAKQDRWDDATKTLGWIRMLPADDSFIQQELQDIRAQNLLSSPSPGTKHTKRYYVKRLLQKGTRNRIGIGLLLMAFQNLTGVNIITYYSPRIFETLGITGTSTKLFATGFYGVAKTLGMIIFSVWLVEKLGRRSGLIWGAFVGSLPMWYLGGYVLRADPTGAAARGDTSRDAWGYLAMVCVYLYGLIYCATWQGITWVVCSEIFPIDIRMLCVAITTADQWLWSFIVSRTTPYMITSLGYGTYMFFAALMVCMGFWAWFFVPETKGKTLEEMDAIFGPAGTVALTESKLGDDKAYDVEESKREVDAYHMERV
ncbi:putative quinate permease protein [Lipomyces tetrasporus]|uniref:Quinate permease protein n=1 Tax=Lipomyces tetrasporus TaxID=54092 RepID=A0AAD7VPU2_9ASCO|nr:putative quinate permease protein [Lipomyces tetrasporus]KAJ8097181.1 putative quinate permease protein [Lipomyces tetrasporus]